MLRAAVENLAEGGLVMVVGYISKYPHAATEERRLTKRMTKAMAGGKGTGGGGGGSGGGVKGGSEGGSGGGSGGGSEVTTHLSPPLLSPRTHNTLPIFPLPSQMMCCLWRPLLPRHPRQWTPFVRNVRRYRDMHEERSSEEGGVRSKTALKRRVYSMHGMACMAVHPDYVPTNSMNVIKRYKSFYHQIALLSCFQGPASDGEAFGGGGGQGGAGRDCQDEGR